MKAQSSRDVSTSAWNAQAMSEILCYPLNINPTHFLDHCSLSALLTHSSIDIHKNCRKFRIESKVGVADKAMVRLEKRSTKSSQNLCGIQLDRCEKTPMAVYNYCLQSMTRSIA